MVTFDKCVQDPAAWKPFWRNIGLYPLKCAGQRSRQRDTNLLNLALMHEDIQAALYHQASKLAVQISQEGLSQEQSRASLAYLTHYTTIEQAHANFLRATLEYMGVPAVKPCAVEHPGNLGSTLKSLMQFLADIKRQVTGAYRGIARHLGNLGVVQLMASLYSAEVHQAWEIQELTGSSQEPPQTYQTPTESIVSLQKFLAETPKGRAAERVFGILCPG